MIVVQEPDLAWRDMTFACNGCGGVVRFESSDLAGMPPIKPRKMRDGSWTILWQCRWCRTMQTFAPHTSVGNDPVPDFERLESDPGSLPATLTTEGM